MICLADSSSRCQKIYDNNFIEFEQYKNNLLLSSIKSGNIKLFKLFFDNYYFDNLYDVFYQSCYFRNLEILKLVHIKILNTKKFNINYNLINKLETEWLTNGIKINYEVINYLKNLP